MKGKQMNAETTVVADQAAKIVQVPQSGKTENKEAPAVAGQEVVKEAQTEVRS